MPRSVRTIFLASVSSIRYHTSEKKSQILISRELPINSVGIGTCICKPRLRYNAHMTKRIHAALIAAFIFATILLVPSTAQAAWYDGRARDGLFIAATAAETQLGWGKYAPPSLVQSGGGCTAFATGNAMRMLLVRYHNWTKDLQWKTNSLYVLNAAGKNPHNVAAYANWPGYPITGSHPNMFATMFHDEVTADQVGITTALNTGPVAFAVNASSAIGGSGNDPHEVAAVYADPVKGVLIQNSWGVGWLGTGFAWVEWPDVDDYIYSDFAHVFYGVDGYRP